MPKHEYIVSYQDGHHALQCHRYDTLGVECNKSKYETRLRVHEFNQHCTLNFSIPLILDEKYSYRLIGIVFYGRYGTKDSLLIDLMP